MAVSMSAGFMRSDFMISDAAIPMRMEELDELEQGAKFSELLGDMTAGGHEKPIEAKPAEEAVTDVSEATEATAELDNPEAALMEKVEEKLTVIISKTDLKALAERVVKGEVRLSELPEELVSDVLLNIIAMMLMGVSESDIPALQQDYSVTVSAVHIEVISKYVEITAVSESAVNLNPVMVQLNMATESDNSKWNSREILGAKPVQQLQQMANDGSLEIPEQLMEELNAVIAEQTENEVKTSETEANAEVTAKPQQAEAELPTQNAEAAVEAGMTAEFTQQAAAEVKPEQAAEVNTVRLENRTAVSGNITRENVQNPAVQGAAVKQVDISEEFSQLKKIVSEVTVKTTEPQQTAAQQTYTSVQQPVTEQNAKGRVVVKSDELQMLKNAAQPTETGEVSVVQTAVKAETAENNPQPEMNFGEQNAAQLAGEMSSMVQSDTPVVFVRSDGTQIEVKPSEVIEQVTTRIVEQVTTNTTETGETEYSITLMPEDLGAITVKLTKAADGALSVSISADNARTQRILEESGLALQNSLRQNGIELESWQTVNQSQQEQRAGDYQGSAKNPYQSEETEPQNEDTEDNSFRELISAM